MKWVSLPASRTFLGLFQRLHLINRTHVHMCVYLCIHYTHQKDNNKVTVCSKQRILIVEAKPITFRKCPFVSLKYQYRQLLVLFYLMNLVKKKYLIIKLSWVHLSSPFLPLFLSTLNFYLHQKLPVRHSCCRENQLYSIIEITQ